MINKIAPPALAEEWDNPGLQLGDPKRPAERIMVALDPGQEAVEAAVAAGCSLLVTHHPLFFRPLKRIDASEPTGGVVFRAIGNNLAILSLHTNYDSADGGLNDLLAERLGLIETRPLKGSAEELVKLAAFVPEGHEERVLEVLFRFSGVIGNYRDCSFRVSGTGTFTPQEGAKPFIGEVGARNETGETRIEVLLRKEDLPAAVKALRAVHPYEEPAFDLYPLLNRGAERGLGRFGDLNADITLAGYASVVGEKLGTDVRYVGDPARRVRRVAVCSGSGSSLLREAVWKGADVFVTGDVKYHEAREAEALGVALIDAGHFATEVIMVDGVVSRLAQEMEKRGFQAEVIPCRAERDPFKL
jgi:dinuclear metal center YbgI/SA1388 family protein